MHPAAMFGPRGSKSLSDSPPGHGSSVLTRPHAQYGLLPEALGPVLQSPSLPLTLLISDTSVETLSLGCN